MGVHMVAINFDLIPLIDGRFLLNPSTSLYIKGFVSRHAQELARSLAMGSRSRTST